MNNRTLSRITIISASFLMLLITFAGLSASAAGLGNTQQFVVEMKVASEMGESAGEVMSAKYYVGKGRIRMDMTMGGMPGGSHISVFDGDQVTMYMLIPQMKQYMKRVGARAELEEEGPALVFGSPEDADHPCQSDPDISCEKIGSDTLLGRAVDKYLVKDIEDGAPTQSTMWIDRELLFPIKIEADDGNMEATSIEIGTQPAELFEIPAGYSEMQMPF
jgi:outer membrane lipoprotein-sorting protein